MEQGQVHTHTIAEWYAEGQRLFGPDMEAWKFVCPNCGNVAAIAEFKPYRHLGAEDDAASYICIGVYQGVKDGAKRPCRYSARTGGGGILCDVRVLAYDRVTPRFSFAEPDPQLRQQCVPAGSQ